ncbi:unnamed protein product [Linum trigynum]|uniref:Uncharacterized protein n=1 Tax=Linum trigynum TaxID=586398 RepID=A0AAV2GPA6_9ROSI
MPRPPSPMTGPLLLRLHQRSPPPNSPPRLTSRPRLLHLLPSHPRLLRGLRLHLRVTPPLLPRILLHHLVDPSVPSREFHL